MERLTHNVDFGLEDWEETLFFVKSDPNGAYNILDIARFQGEAEFDEILKNIALRLAAYEDTGLAPEEVQIRKECYGKCRNCVWAYNGGCNMWTKKRKEVVNDR